ncbi:hypothetical protein ACHQM5_010399 [Ranunculus cassubicifolius]
MMKKKSTTAMVVGFSTGFVMIAFYFGLFNFLLRPVLVVEPDISGPHRKLLTTHGPATVKPNRLWGEKCSKEDIVVNQGPTAPLPNGIPTYTVEISNVCSKGCNISRIHVTCGWFSSARLINPKIFKRLHYDDCLVNNGRSLLNGRSLSFQYANTFPYKLTVKKVYCV